MSAEPSQLASARWAHSRVLVTGGAAGIGLALARAAAARGAAVALADIEHDVAEQQAAMMTENGAHAIAVACDVMDDASVEAAVAETADRLGGINVLCANAGVGSSGGVKELSSDDFAWILQVNLFGAYRSIRAAVPHLEKQAAAGNRAHVLVTGSENSLGLPDHVPAMTAYQTSKHALLGLTDCIRRDLAPSGVGATLLCPSYVATEGWNAKRTRPPRYGGPEQADPSMRAALHRLGQDPDEVAELALQGIDENVEIVVTSEASRACADVRARQVATAFERLSTR